MVDRKGGSGRDDPDDESVLDLLDEIAEAEGVSREEAVDHLVSSYWRLEEVADMLEQNELRPEADHDERQTPPFPDEDEIADLHARVDDLIGDLRGDRQPSSDRDDLRDSIASLVDKIERLEEQMEAEPADEPDEAVDTVESQLSDLRHRFESIEGSVSDLEARIDDIDDGTVSEEELESFLTQIETFQSQITRDHETLRDRVLEEFEHIRTVLESLLTKTDAHGDRIAGIESQEGQFREFLRQQEQLRKIKRLADRAQVNSARCELCDEVVDLSLLETPVCPSCEHDITDLETERGFLGLSKSGVLRVSR